MACVGLAFPVEDTLAKMTLHEQNWRKVVYQTIVLPAGKK